MSSLLTMAGVPELPLRGHATIRIVVVALLAASFAYALFFARPIVRTASEIADLVAVRPEVAFAAVAGAAMVLAGHVLRAYRGRLLFREVADTTVRTQLGAFAAGSLCNAVLPLKLGELVRADIIAQRYSVSFSFSFVLALLERLLDCVILLGLSAVFVGFYLPLAAAASVLFAVLLVLYLSPRWFKRVLTATSGVLNERASSRMLFAFWSLEYGLRRTVVARVMVPYVLLAIANWVLYVAAFVPILFSVGEGALGCVEGSVGAYVALTTAISPAALGSYSATLGTFGLSDSVVFIVLWACAVVPTSLVGLYFVFVKLRGLPLLRTGAGDPSAEPVENKLSRVADISSDQAGFLRDYYGGSDAACRIAERDIVGEVAFGRYFSGGGSGAVTYLSRRDGEYLVTKEVPLANSSALKEQCDWLRSHEGPMIAAVLGEREDDESYSIDVEYERGSIDFFEFLHLNSVRAGERAVDEVVAMLASNVWRVGDGLETVPCDDARELIARYLARNVDGSLEIAQGEMPSLSCLLLADELIVNGERCPNIAALLGEIRSRREIMDDLCSFRRSASIHGDLIVDNVIWSPSKGCPVVLDPVPSGNFLDGPVFDFGKLCQSLLLGYEFMLRDTDRVEVHALGDGLVSVSYSDFRSAVYESLWRHVCDDLAPRYLTESERRTMLFLGATNYMRRMKYQAAQCPANAAKFYAAGVLNLSRYVRLFG